MNFLIILKVALRSLRRTMLRSGLTVLGMIVGVGAVIAMVSIGNGARADIERSLANTDLSRLAVNVTPAGQKQWLTAGNLPQLGPGDRLTVADRDALVREVPGILLAGVSATGAGVNAVRANERQSSVSVTGIEPAVMQINRYKLVRGSGFGASDIASAASVCIISRFLAQKLFGAADPIGRRVRLGDIPFVVVGVRESADGGGMMAAGREDTGVLIPYTSLLRRLNPKASLVFVVKVQDPGQLNTVRRGIKDVLESRRGKRRVDFNVINSADGMEAFKATSRTMTLLLGAIGGISLLVGGINIMNIMLVSVTERTREIGIRLAIGTRGRDVLRQFLIESIVLSVIGGAIGILLGSGAAKLITYTNGWPTAVTLGSIVSAFLCSAAIGVFFGFYPARQAARLDPIQALRAE